MEKHIDLMQYPSKIKQNWNTNDAFQPSLAAEIRQLAPRLVSCATIPAKPAASPQKPTKLLIQRRCT